MNFEVKPIGEPYFTPGNLVNAMIGETPDPLGLTEQVLLTTPPVLSEPGANFYKAVLGEAPFTGTDLKFLHSDNSGSYFEASVSRLNRDEGQENINLMAERIGRLLGNPALAIEMKNEPVFRRGPGTFATLQGVVEDA